MIEIKNIVGYDSNTIQEQLQKEKEKIKEDEKNRTQKRFFIGVMVAGTLLKVVSINFGILPAVIGIVGTVIFGIGFIACLWKCFTCFPYTSGDKYKLLLELENRELLSVHLKNYNSETAVVILTLEDKDKNIIKKEVELDCIRTAPFDEITFSLIFPYVHIPSAGTKYWANIEEKVEGKEILTLSANDIGCIIRFTDGSMLKYIYGTMEYLEKGDN